MLELRNVQIQKEGQPLIDLPTLNVASGDIVTLMGPSGSGKSTLLNWLIGAPLPAFACSGEIFLHGARVDHLPTAQRRIGLRFHEAGLFPHMSVMDNLLFALPKHLVRGRHERRLRAEALLEAMQLQALAGRMPASLSGGQAARISLARALINEPHAMLLDEPFAALDQATKASVRAWTFQHLQHRQVATILVTHDLADAPTDGTIIRL